MSFAPRMALGVMSILYASTLQQTHLFSASGGRAYGFTVFLSSILHDPSGISTDHRYAVTGPVGATLPSPLTVQGFVVANDNDRGVGAPIVTPIDGSGQFDYRLSHSAASIVYVATAYAIVFNRTI